MLIFFFDLRDYNVLLYYKHMLQLLSAALNA